MTSELDPRDTSDDALANDPLAQAARRAHAVALDRLSSSVQAQLAQRRRAALSPRAAATRTWPWLATASAMTVMLVIGAFAIRSGDSDRPGTEIAASPAVTPDSAVTATPSEALPSPEIASTPTPASVTATSDPALSNRAVSADRSLDDLPDVVADNLIAAEYDTEADGTGVGYDALDESPDFYEWLGSEDAQADAPELL